MTIGISERQRQNVAYQRHGSSVKLPQLANSGGPIWTILTMMPQHPRRPPASLYGNISSTLMFLSVPMHKFFLKKKSCKAPISTSGNSEIVCYNEPINFQTSAGYGGLEDEDDDKKWETIKQSPAKGPEVCIFDHVNHYYVRLSTPH